MANVNKSQNRQLRPPKSTAGLRIRLLGPVTVEIDGVPVVIASKKARALLGYLVQRGGTGVARNTIIGLLWSERGEEQARASLRQTLFELRATLTRAKQKPFNASNESITWAGGSAWIDSEELENAAQSDDDEALRGAALLIRGEFMEGLSVDEAAFEHWLTGERERFRQVACTVHTRLMDRAERSGDIEEALNHGLKLISLDPLQEQVHRALMRLYSAQGRNDASLAQYERCKRELSSQLGVQPEPETETLARSIRTDRRTGRANVQVQTPHTPALPDKPSIAVLPFTNMSADPEQEYFADGLAEDLITDLSKVPGLLVIARNSSFTYKGKHVDIRSVARDLGVRYVIEGSVRRAAARVRINVQLIDAERGTHLWADRFDRDLADVFLLQDEVVGKILSALADVLPSVHPVARRRATNLEAYDLFVRGRVLAMESPESNKVARLLLENAIELDPDFTEAHAWLAMSHIAGRAMWGFAMDRDRSMALAAAQHAVALDPDNADAHMTLGYVHTYDGELLEGEAEFATALRLNPNHADAWAFLTDVKVLEGRPVEGIDCARNALRLNPHPPGVYYTLLGWAQYAAGRYQDAAEALQHLGGQWIISHRLLAASLAQLGRIEEAKEEAKQYLAANPSFTVQEWGRTQPFLHATDRQHFIDGYLKAGLPM